MKQVQGTLKAVRNASEDVISSMPDNVISNILDRLSIPEAIATGILSRNWRYKWTLLTQIIFDDWFSDYLFGLQGVYDSDWRDVSRLLFHLKGPIRKFHLYIPNYKVLNQVVIDHWVLLLSRKGIKEFALLNMHEMLLRLPSHILSCLELKHLKLRNCYFHLKLGFCGFLSLLSLDLYGVTFEGGNCGEMITKCPLLEILKISYHDSIGEVKLDNFAKLENLKVLYLPLRKVENIAVTSSSIVELGSYLPKLKELYLDYRHYNVSTTNPMLGQAIQFEIFLERYREGIGMEYYRL